MEQLHEKAGILNENVLACQTPSIALKIELMSANETNPNKDLACPAPGEAVDSSKADHVSAGNSETAAGEADATKGATNTRSRARLQSTQLNRALQELESAFSDWESITPTPQTTSVQKASSNPAADQEFKRKTQKLLEELRQQLLDL